MRFSVIVGLLSPVGKKDTVCLVDDKRNSRYTYATLFNVVYYDKEGKEFFIGRVKIGQKGQIEKCPDLPRTFDCLSEDFFL